MTADLLARFQRCRQVPECDEVHVAALVGVLLDPDLDVEAVESDLLALARGCPPDQLPWRYLQERGFCGNASDYGSLNNSNLAHVLDTRQGIPISLGVVLIGVSRQSGRQAAGINFPGHFLVQVDEVLVDPFVMALADSDQLVQGLPAEVRSQPHARLFAPASPVEVGLRMLNNIRLNLTEQAAWHRALDVLDAQLTLAPDQPVLHLEKGDVWRRLGAVAPAMACWARAVDVAASLGEGPAEAVRLAVQARRRSAGGAGDDVLH